MKKIIIKKLVYKGHTITLFEDEYQQRFAIIDNDETRLYSNVADAKRIIRGESPLYEIIKQ